MTRFFAVILVIALLFSMSACPPDPDPDPDQEPGPDLWSEDAYNAKFRMFPNAPANGILTYPWDSGTNNYFDQNAPVSYWNTQGCNHKYPDLFRFANGNPVRNIADWELRRQEIFNILQYYMHGRMPSIINSVLRIEFTDVSNTSTQINMQHRDSGRTASMTVTHTPPAGAVTNAKDRIILFGVGAEPTGRDPAWGTAALQTVWAGSESNRTGACATLYGFDTNAADTPSINMQYAWVMSVILHVIEQGGFRGYYDPDKVGIYGFSRWGKAAMCIGAFAEGRLGSRIGHTHIGSAGSGGPSIDRWINQMGYMGHTVDPLPVNGGGINTSTNYSGITWYMRSITDSSSAPANVKREAVRGWTESTPGIPAGSHIYGESDSTKEPGPPHSWGRIQVLSQARAETPGWFSARFQQFSNAAHGSANLDIGSGGVLCTMPFDAHFIGALIAPRIIHFEDGYNTMRNNPEGQWANWLMIDEVYQMYAEQLGDSSIIWRNAIKFYDIDHSHFSYQNDDEVALVNAIYNGTPVDPKFRTPPFPADDPRYRWDFDRMDWGRPGHPTIAERVRRMRESPVPVKAVDTRGLLDNPEPLN